MNFRKSSKRPSTPPPNFLNSPGDIFSVFQIASNVTQYSMKNAANKMANPRDFNFFPFFDKGHDGTSAV